jgi:osmotically-inducible protein OsmY
MKNRFNFFPPYFVALVLITAVGCVSTPTQQGAGEYLDDSVITTRVKARLINDPKLRSGEINVETFKGIVQLSGFVSSRAEINRAVQITRDVNGVVSVKNDMRLK